MPILLVLILGGITLIYWLPGTLYAFAGGIAFLLGYILFFVSTMYHPDSRQPPQDP